MWSLLEAPTDMVTGGPASSRGAVWGGTALLFAAFIVLAGMNPLAVDDMLITFQYAKNLVEHGVLTWWPDAPLVDGYTSLGHVLLLAALHLAGLNLVAANTLLNFGALVVISMGILRATAMFRPWVRLAAVSVTLINASFMFWIAGGLDGILYTAALLWTYLVYESAIENSNFGAGLAALMLALAAIRPEGMFIALALIIFFFAVQLRRRRWPIGVVWPIAVLTAIAGLIAWRIWMYGHPVPNTYYAKASASLTLEIGQGLDYFWIWLSAQGGMILLATPIALAMGSGKWLRALFVAGLIAITILAGGDPHPFGRFFLPVIPFVALDCAWVLNTGRRALRRFFGVAHVAYLFFQIALVQGGWEIPRTIRDSMNDMLTGRWPHLTYQDSIYVSSTRALVHDLDKSLVADLPLAATDVGALAYFSNRWVRDAIGLNDPELAHLPKPENKSNTWGISNLGVLLAREVPLAYSYFPVYDDVAWTDVAGGARSCAFFVKRRMENISQFATELDQSYLCASIEAQDLSGRYINLFVHKDIGMAAFTTPDRVTLSQCVPQVFAACDLPVFATSQ
ncbi:MAG: hypothetical protein AAGF33_18025 [Pseudomonadota bacterium]